MRQAYADDAMLAKKFDQRIGKRAFGIALAIRLDVAQVANMSGLISRCTMSLVVWIDCRSNN